MEPEEREEQREERWNGPPPLMVSTAPYNAETPPEVLGEELTPVGSFFVRQHHETPRLGPEHRLTVAGAVEQPLELSLEELERLPRRTVRMTLECAGNGRMGLVPLPGGVPWGRGAVGTAEWMGVSLGEVLRRARPAAEAVEVVAWGADGEGAKRYGRGLPLEKAWQEEVLLAWGMNGERLRREHGGPLRLVVPGWYGMASVKWLTRLELWTRSFDGYYQRVKYVFDRGDGSAPRPVTRVRVKSLILSPHEGERVDPGRVWVEGVAWSGERRVVRVEVAVDGGEGWESAVLLGESRPSAWVRWGFTWEASPGRHVLRVRATDEAGETQPDEGEWNRHGYGNNAVEARRVEVG
jgi:DMSO/TMAO reductase YedYZ molybdopterin-dependent catalytic subunit